MIVTAAVLLVLAGMIYLFLQQPQFGKLASGERLEMIKKSPNYKNGAFQNLSDTPSLTEGASFFSVMKEFLFLKNETKKPDRAIPSAKTDLLGLNPAEDTLVWFGHSSYFMQIDAKKILVDPVFSGSASPVSFTTRAFEGADRYTADDMPEIDYLFITHDHWDHLDYKTIMDLKPKIKTIICGLGTGAHFEHWGFDLANIIEKDWNESFQLEEGFQVHTVPARHFSGRGLTRNKALWMSYVLQTPKTKLFIGGDSGYDSHFAAIGRQFGPFDIAILENGQYDKSWKYIHMMPEEVFQAAKDLNAKKLFPVHSSKFVLANHSWNEPLAKITKLIEEKGAGIFLMTPKIGEKTYLKGNLEFPKWWEFPNEILME